MKLVKAQLKAYIVRNKQEGGYTYSKPDDVNERKDFAAGKMAESYFQMGG